MKNIYRHLRSNTTTLTAKIARQVKEIGAQPPANNTAELAKKAVENMIAGIMAEIAMILSSFISFPLAPEFLFPFVHMPREKMVSSDLVPRLRQLFP